jgi:hypothetical protein
MNIKIIIFNVFLIVFLFSLIYLYVYINYTYEGFEVDEDTIESNALNQDETIRRINPTMDEIDRDGSSPNLAINSRILPYLNYSRRSFPNRPLAPLGDNYYWITLPDIGDRFIYCIMDTKYAGGGWMLAMRGVRGSKTFGYNSNYWTTTNTFNSNYQDIIKTTNNNSVNLSTSSIGDLIFNDYENNSTEINRLDAKYDTFNWYPASEWMAIFYYKQDVVNGRPIYYKGGDKFDNLPAEDAKGWIWRETNVNIRKNQLISARNLFVARGRLQSTNSLMNLTGKYNKSSAKGLDKFNLRPEGFPQLWSSQAGYNFYGINYEIRSHSSAKSYVRWGFAWNNENDTDTNDVFAGIGCGHNNYSCGDFITCCEDGRGVNSSIAFEWYVR